MNDSSRETAVILACHRETAPDAIFIEGQASLRNPMGPCGSEMVLAGGAKGVILQHAPAREFFDELVEIIKNKVRSGGAP